MLDIVHLVVDHLCLTDKFSRVELLPRILPVCMTLRKTFALMEKQRRSVVADMWMVHLVYPLKAPKKRRSSVQLWTVYAPTRSTHEIAVSHIVPLTTRLAQPYATTTPSHSIACVRINSWHNPDSYYTICVYRWISRHWKWCCSIGSIRRSPTRLTAVNIDDYDSSHQIRGRARGVAYNPDTKRLEVYVTGRGHAEGVVRYYDAARRLLIWSKSYN